MINSGYSCSSSPSICSNVCGNGVKNSTEACDDGNLSNGDGCSNACLIEHGYTCTLATPNICSKICGDGLKAANEACDDGGVSDNDGCS